MVPTMVAVALPALRHALPRPHHRRAAGPGALDEVAPELLARAHDRELVDKVSLNRGELPLPRRANGSQCGG